MKSALVESFKTFLATVKSNTVELAKKTCENNGYKVTVPHEEKPTKKSKK